jgi:hypothetical protein
MTKKTYNRITAIAHIAGLLLIISLMVQNLSAQNSPKKTESDKCKKIKSEIRIAEKRMRKLDAQMDSIYRSNPNDQEFDYIDARYRATRERKEALEQQGYKNKCLCGK